MHDFYIHKMNDRTFDLIMNSATNNDDFYKKLVAPFEKLHLDLLIININNKIRDTSKASAFVDRVNATRVWPDVVADPIVVEGGPVKMKISFVISKGRSNDVIGAPTMELFQYVSDKTDFIGNKFLAAGLAWCIRNGDLYQELERAGVAASPKSEGLSFWLSRSDGTTPVTTRTRFANMSIEYDAGLFDITVV